MASDGALNRSGRSLDTEQNLSAGSALPKLLPTFNDPRRFSGGIEPCHDQGAAGLDTNNLSSPWPLSYPDQPVDDLGHLTRSPADAYELESQPTDLGNSLAESGGEKAGAISRRYLAHRRLRAQLFGSGLFADPAWDILLDLYAHRMDGRSISVSSACLAAGVPTSTALGWVVRLEQKGLIYREVDPHDGRRTFVRLSHTTADSISHWLAALLPT